MDIDSLLESNFRKVNNLVKTGSIKGDHKVTLKMLDGEPDNDGITEVDLQVDWDILSNSTALTDIKYSSEKIVISAEQGVSFLSCASNFTIINETHVSCSGPLSILKNESTINQNIQIEGSFKAHINNLEIAIIDAKQITSEIVGVNDIQTEYHVRTAAVLTDE
jgi:hypothetical protein